MKVVCINPFNKFRDIKIIGLTYGKIYDTIDIEDELFYYIKDDMSHINEYLKRRFISLEKWRELRISKILKL